MGCKIDMSDTTEELDSNLKEFYSCVENVFNPLIKTNITNGKQNNDDQCKEKQPGYDLECKISQSVIYKQLKFLKAR